MKILLTGATGFIGTELLTQALAHPYIHKVIVLTRRPLDPPVLSNKKLHQIIHADFEVWPDSLLAELRALDIEACIWALGGKVEQFATLDEARKVGISFPVIGAEALAKGVAAYAEPWEGMQTGKRMPAGAKRFPFRFVYLSGWGAEHDQFRKLWIFAESRRIKGAAEKALFEIADGSEEKGVEREGEGEEGRRRRRCFDVIALRPGGVIKGGEGIVTLVSEATVPCIAVDRLAKCAIGVALDGSDGRRTMENKDCLGEGWAMVNSFSF